MKPLHYYWYRFKWNLVEHTNWTPKKLMHLDLELFKDCNLKCTMCDYGNNPTFKMGKMEFSTAINAIDEAASLGVHSIKFNLRGESGLSKDLEPLISYAKSKGIRYLMLNTNLVVFNKQRIAKLCDSGLDIIIVSIDGGTRATYEKIRQGAKWSKLVKNLMYLNSHKKRPIIRIQMTYQDENRQELNDFKDKFTNLCDEMNIKPIRSDNKDKQRKLCGQPKQRIIIGFDGTYYGCCNSWNEESKLGSFKTIKDAFKSNARSDLLFWAKAPQNGGICKDCLVRSSYK